MSEIKTEDPQVRPRLSDAHYVLGHTLLELAKIAPARADVRAMILARCMQAPPVDCDTYDKIVDWVEHNIKNPALKTTTPSRRHAAGANTIIVEASTSETEYGHCSYTCHLNGNSQVEVNIADLLDTEPDTWDELWGAIDDELGYRVWENNEFDARDDCEHDNYESDNSDNAEWEIGRAEKLTAMDAAKEIVRRLNPELYSRLEGLLE